MDVQKVLKTVNWLVVGVKLFDKRLCLIYLLHIKQNVSTL